MYRFPVIEVDVCPTTNKSWYEAGIHLNCTYDESKRFQYLCIPNKNKTALLEFCYNKIMGLYEKGHCLHLSDSGILDQENCSMFNEGCPQQPYFSSEIFQYQKCLLINIHVGCFIEDHKCPFKDPRITGDTEDLGSSSTAIYLPLLFFIIVLVTAMVFICRKCFKIRKKSQALSKEKRDRSVDVCQRINKVCFKSEMDVTWEKDGRQIHNDNRHVTDKLLILYDVNDECKGKYKGIGRHNASKTCSIELDIETLNLEGPVKAFSFHEKSEEKIHQLGPSPRGRNFNLLCCLHPSNYKKNTEQGNKDWKTIWTTREKKDKHCNILVTKYNNTTSPMLSSDVFSHDAEKKLIFFVALLLSKKRSLQRNTRDTENLFNAAEHFFPDFVERTTVNECFLEADLWVDSLCLSQDTVRFVSDEVEAITLWTLLQNCQIPKNVLEYIFDHRLTKLCMKYFRLQGYKRHENEPCIYLPQSFEDRYLECIIEEYILKLDDEINYSGAKENGGDFDQRSSSVFECIMYYCFTIERGSKELISRYFRTSSYVKNKDERSICVPNDITKELIKRLGIDIIVHQTSSDTSCHQNISEICRIPEEILKWDLEAKQRFVENFKRGNVPVYRARCLIVGCAGAGKTTLLRNLQRKGNISSRSATETTKGLDVHENLFRIAPAKDDKKQTLYDYKIKEMSSIRCLGWCIKKKTNDPHFLSVMDFAGQVAYYACHQIYFSRRAIYLLVVDMSQDLKAEMENNDRHNVQGSLFEHWSYQDYFGFWIQTIRTYSEEDKKTFSSPVIVIATHKDTIQAVYREEKVDHHDDFHEQLMRGIPETIQYFFNTGSHKYYELELPPKKKTKEQLQNIEEVRKSIAESVTSLPQWGELIPATWLQFEQIIQEQKKNKIIFRDEMRNLYVKEDDLDDMLRFYHEIGIILFFPDEDLRNTIIVDIQWFIDSFKSIITDETHVSKIFRLKPNWREFNRSGMLPESLLIEIWENEESKNYIQHKDKIIPYMEKLGIVVRVEFTDNKEPHYYIPSINKIDLMKKKIDEIEEVNHTSILSFHFKTFLPHFFFYRLVVALLKNWRPAGKDKLMKNAAIFNSGEQDEYHNVVVAVNKTSIQLQVFTPAKSIPLQKGMVKHIQSHVQNKIQEISSTFHRKADYELGFPCPCMSVKIADEDEGCFISEEILQKKVKNVQCPNCQQQSQIRQKEEIMRHNYWMMN